MKNLVPKYVTKKYVQKMIIGIRKKKLFINFKILKRSFNNINLPYSFKRSFNSISFNIEHRTLKFDASSIFNFLKDSVLLYSSQYCCPSAKYKYLSKM